MLGATAPAQAASPQIDGTAEFQLPSGGPCEDDPPAGPVRRRRAAGDAGKPPGGVHLERGEELFVGRLRNGAMGTFTTTYRFEAKPAADGSEIRGRCQHPIVAGSGTGGLTGATGRLDFKDIIEVPITCVYRGQIRFR